MIFVWIKKNISERKKNACFEIFGVFGLFFFIFLFYFFFYIVLVIFKVTVVTTKSYRGTTEHQKWPKISTNSVKNICFFPRSPKKASTRGRSPPQVLEVSLRSGLYLLVKYYTLVSSYLVMVKTPKNTKETYP